MSYIIEKVTSFLKDENTEAFLSREKNKKTPKHSYRFKLLDDDGIEYFKGSSTIKWDFEPLDGFGLSYGCTEIKYWDKNRYVTL